MSMRITRFGRTTGTLGAAAVLALVLVSCHGKSDGGGATPPPSGSAAGSGGGASAKNVTVDVKNFTFNPGTVTVAKGGKVTWKFEDSADHNVDFDKLNKKSPDLANGKSYSMTFNQSGSYDYICSIHQYMSGKVDVK